MASTLFETCSAQFSTDQLEQLLSCVSDGHRSVSGRSKFMTMRRQTNDLNRRGPVML